MTAGDRVPRSGRSSGWWSVFFALPTAYLYIFLRSLWRIGDEGSIVYGAQRVAEGALPYRDFFEVMGPGTFYWLALWFKVLGTTWFASRAAVLTTALLAAWAIYVMSARVLHGQRFVLLPTVVYSVMTVPMWPGANHHFDSNAWALLAVAACAWRNPFNRRSATIAGLLAGLAATVIPQKGVLVLLALLTATVWEGWRQQDMKRARVAAAVMVTAFGCVGLSVVAFYAAQGALLDLIYAMAIWPATQYHAVNVVPYGYGLRELFLASWRPGLEAALRWPASLVAVAMVIAPFVFVLLLPLLASVSVLQHWFARAGTGTSGRAPVPPLYWCAGPALFLAEFHRPDMKHLVYGSPILLILVTRWLTESGTAGRIALQSIRVCTVALALFNGILAVRPGSAVDTRVGPIRMTTRDDALDFLQTTIPPGGTAFVYPYYPMYYFLANVRNPTRYSILMHHINTPMQFEETIAALETQKVPYVLWDTFVAGENLTRWFPGYVDPPYQEQHLEQYLRRHYTEIGVRNGFRVLERR